MPTIPHRLNWIRQRERGSALTMRLMAWIALRLGRPAARILLYPICLYFVIFSGPARRATHDFLVRVLGRPVMWRDIFHQYLCFAATILDRVYLLVGRHRQFEVIIQGKEVLGQFLSRGHGCVLLGSHLGSYEIARAVASSQCEHEIKVLMYEHNAPMITSLMRSLNPDAAAGVIPVGAPGAILQVKECLDRGGMVGILGDRAVEYSRTTRCTFLGRPASFPDGPIRLTSVLSVPVFLFFGLYRGGNRYDVYFELFAERVSIDQNQPQQQIQHWLQRYADRLEHYCRLAPDNWFNFYDFWDRRCD
jgi:predicted LPLAT superfamily acyltransferase